MTKTPTLSPGEMIRNARERKGIPRTKLAEFTGVKPNSMVRYEKAGEEGGKYPSLQNMVRICRVLEIDPRRVFQRVMEFDDPVDDPINFLNYFATDIDFLNWKLSVKNIEELNLQLLSLQAEIFNLSQKLEPEKGSGPVRIEPSRPSDATNHPEAAPTASDHHSMKEAQRDDPE